MKDIKIDTPLIKVQYIISWVGFILAGGVILALYLASYGKDTHLNKPSIKGVLNKTWQKFVFILGSILGDILIVSIFLNLISFLI